MEPGQNLVPLRTGADGDGRGAEFLTLLHTGPNLASRWSHDFTGADLFQSNVDLDLAVD